MTSFEESLGASVNEPVLLKCRFTFLLVVVPFVVVLGSAGTTVLEVLTVRPLSSLCGHYELPPGLLDPQPLLVSTKLRSLFKM